MQVEYKTSKGVILFLKVPDDYTGIAGMNFGKIYFWTSTLIPNADIPLSVEIPNGKWQLIGLSNEVTEEQAKMMVDSKYPSYGSNGEFTEQWAYDSFKSIMKHLELYEVNPVEFVDHFGIQLEYLQKYREAQERTGKFAVLFKPE